MLSFKDVLKQFSTITNDYLAPYGVYCRKTYQLFALTTMTILCYPRTIVLQHAGSNEKTRFELKRKRLHIHKND